MSKIKDSRIWWILGVLLVCALILWPMLRSGFWISDDGEWMIIRLTAFFQSLAAGQFPVRFLTRLNHGYGYPVANFLYPGFLYLGSFLHGIGFSYVTSVKLILAVSVVATALFLFLFLKRRFNSLASFMGTLAFIFSPYLFFDIYTRGSVGEVLAFAPAAAAFYSIAAGKPWLFALSFGMLIVSHNSLALIFVLSLLVFLVVSRSLKQFALPLVIGLGLSAFFWIPAVFERRLVAFDTVTVANSATYLINKETSWLLGWVTLIAFLFAVVSKKTKDAVMRIIILLVGTGYFLSLPVSGVLWKLPALALLFQFPYRFLAISTLLGSWLVAFMIEQVKKGHLRLLVGLFGFLWMTSLIPQFSRIEFVVRPEAYYTTNEGTTTVADEYLPRWVHDKPSERPTKKLEIIKGDAQVISEKLTMQKTDITLEVKEESLVQLNTIYYPGWGVTVDRQRILPSYRNPKGVMQLTVPVGTHRIVSEFRETPLRFGADMILVISLGAWLFLLLRSNIKYKRSK